MIPIALAALQLAPLAMKLIGGMGGKKEEDPRAAAFLPPAREPVYSLAPPPGSTTVRPVR